MTSSSDIFVVRRWYGVMLVSLSILCLGCGFFFSFLGRLSYTAMSTSVASCTVYWSVCEQISIAHHDTSSFLCDAQ